MTMTDGSDDAEESNDQDKGVSTNSNQRALTLTRTVTAKMLQLLFDGWPFRQPWHTKSLML
jgi:hypothetical protein